MKIEKFDFHCPHCGEGVDIDTSDGYGLSEGDVFTQECQHCGDEFDFTTSITYSHEIIPPELYQ